MMNVKSVTWNSRNFLAILPLDTRWQQEIHFKYLLPLTQSYLAVNVKYVGLVIVTI